MKTFQSYACRLNQVSLEKGEGELTFTEEPLAWGAPYGSSNAPTILFLDCVEENKVAELPGRFSLDSMNPLSTGC